jgi:hypothetical protein
MGEIVSFQRYRPPIRYDGLPWTEVRIEEATAESGPWVLIDTLALSPLDTNPANPRYRSFTTENGTGTELWYRVIFADADGDVSEPTAATQHISTQAPAVAAATTEICSLWASIDDMTACCSDLLNTDETTLEWALQQASEMLYKLSGHRYPGVCEATVRPCGSRASCWTPVSEWFARDCGCTRLSRVRLAGYPVQAITEVLIDDEVIDPGEYRLDYDRELVRLADADGRAQTWPGCQRLDLSDGPGTFFITYTYGQNPPLTGVQAAAELACEIAKACPGVSGSAGECALPTGTVRIARQGITIDTQVLGLWLLGMQRTGLTMVDAFLSAWGSARRRRTALAVPEADAWPLRVG